MDKYNWKKALDYVLHIANQKKISQATLAKDVISLSHFNKMCNGKENVKADLVFACASKVGVDYSKILEIARSEEDVIYLEFKDKLTKLLQIQDYQSLVELIKEIEPYKDIDKYFSQLYYRTYGLVEGAINASYEKALKYFKKSLKVIYPKLTFDQHFLMSVTLNEMDLEIISSIAICFKELERYSEAIEVYLFIIHYIESHHIITDSHPKTCYNLGRAYEKIGEYQKEYDYSCRGIKYSIQHQIYTQYGFLFFSKAVSEYYLGIENSSSFDFCIHLFTLQGRDDAFIDELKNDKIKYSLQKDNKKAD